MMRLTTDRGEEWLLQEPDLVSELFGRPMSVAREGHLELVQRELQSRLLNQSPTSRVIQQIDQTHQNTLALCRDHALPIDFVGYGKLPVGHQVFEGFDCDWVLMGIPDDPLFVHRQGRLPVPQTVKSDILRMVEVGVEFSATYIAHGVPKGAMYGQSQVSLEQVMPLPDPRVSSRLRRLDKSILKLGQATKSSIKAIAVAGAAVSFGALAVPALLAATLPVGAAVGSVFFLDPILFGVQLFDGWMAEDGRPIGSWYYLAHWYWPLEKVK